MTKHTILFLAANQLGTNRLALDENAQPIQQALEHSGRRDHFELVTTLAVQPLDRLRDLRKLPPTIVQLSGLGGRGRAATCGMSSERGGDPFGADSSAGDQLAIDAADRPHRKSPGGADRPASNCRLCLAESSGSSRYAAPVGADDFTDLEHGATEAHPRKPLADASGVAFAITVTEGPDAGAQLQIDESDPSPLLVGQSPACALRLRDPRVSRRHLTLEIAGERLRITDLDSTNGTVCAGLAVRDAYLRGGESLQIGQTQLRVERRAGPALPAPSDRSGFGRVLGASPAMRRLYPLIERLAASEIPMVIEGETGTGKEALAEAIHELGPRAGGPFVVFDCTATPAQLMESDLFGHERGAFTGAVSLRKGVFELAHGGTLLIDEIGELDVALQPKLLRAIERSEIRRVGSGSTVRVDVRIVAATRRDLDKQVQQQQFRDDLFYRLAVGRIELPALRRRQGDIALLARSFWVQLGGDPAALTAEAIRRWEAEDWPGNVRQLRNAVARTLALGDLAGDDAAPDGEPPPSVGAADADFLDAVIAERLPLPMARMRVVKEFEQRYIAALLAEHGTVARAAAASGIARRYFQLLRGGRRRES